MFQPKPAAFVTYCSSEKDELRPAGHRGPVHKLKRYVKHYQKSKYQNLLIGVSLGVKVVVRVCSVHTY